MNKTVKPLFKYIGGKSWLRESLREHVIKAMSDKVFLSYAEPFAGGLGSFLSIYDILVDSNIKSVVLSDINSNLINTYQLIKDSPYELISEYTKLEKEFIKYVPTNWILSSKDKDKLKIILKPAEIYFNVVKKDFNENKQHLSAVQSARLIFLQKHAFNGVYRENSKGYYNTPFNWSGSNMLDSISEKVLELNQVFIKLNVSFKAQSFEDMNCNQETLYYLDPPYINEEIGENKYNKDIFDLYMQMILLDKIKDVSFIYSNHKADILMKKFECVDDINIQEIMRKNIMSSNSDSRKQEKSEILVRRVKSF